MAIDGVESTLPDPEWIRKVEALLAALVAQTDSNTQDISNLNRG